MIKSYRQGFILSLLSASKWLLAYIVTLILFPRIKPYFKDLIDSEYVLDVTLGGLRGNCFLTHQGLGIVVRGGVFCEDRVVSFESFKRVAIALEKFGAAIHSVGGDGGEGIFTCDGFEVLHGPAVFPGFFSSGAAIVEALSGALSGARFTCELGGVGVLTTGGEEK